MTDAEGSKWDLVAKVYARIEPPLLPSPQDVQAVRTAIAGCDENVLLLGVTPAYSVLGQKLSAIDSAEGMIKGVWPGDDARRKAQLGNWTDLPFPDHSFTAVIGDGCLNSVARGLPGLLPEIRRVLAPEGVAAFRTFFSPDEPENLPAIREEILTRPNGTAVTMRIRVQMALAAARADWMSSPAEGLQASLDLFPDEQELIAATGWSLEDIRGRNVTGKATYDVGFPTRSRLQELAGSYFRDISFIESSGYLLADRCPIMVMS